MVTFFRDVTAFVVMANVALLEPAGTVIDAGTATTDVSELSRLTT
jgi:hypothetical protein